MPATDALQPPLSEGARAIRREYGGWTNFMLSYGLKPTDSDDAAEGKAIIEAMAKARAGEERSSGSKGGTRQ